MRVSRIATRRRRSGRGKSFRGCGTTTKAPIENRDGNGGYATKAQIGEALDALGYRILWVVSYVDTGEVREEYREESEAQERCEAAAPTGC